MPVSLFGGYYSLFFFDCIHQGENGYFACIVYRLPIDVHSKCVNTLGSWCSIGEERSERERISHVAGGNRRVKKSRNYEVADVFIA